MYMVYVGIVFFVLIFECVDCYRVIIMWYFLMRECLEYGLDFYVFSYLLEKKI